MNIHEPGSNTQLYDEIFAGIKRDVVPLLQEIKEKPPIDDGWIKGDYSVEKQEKLARHIMEILGLDMSRVGLATADHPFTRNMGSHFDERIATRYSRKDFTFSLYTMLFSCGHILCEMGQDDEIGYTLADGSASFGILEGQTRFYENMVGRSRAFIQYLHPELKAMFPASMRESIVPVSNQA